MFQTPARANKVYARYLVAHVHHYKGYKPTTLHLFKSVLCREHVDDANEPGSYVFQTSSMSMRPHNNDACNESMGLPSR